MRTLLVTGALGMCGRAVAAAARASGTWQVIATARRPGAAVDVVHDLRDPLPIGEGPGAFPPRIDGIVHTAASLDQRGAGFDVVDANVRAAFNLASYAAAAQCRGIVHLSSVSVYGWPKRGERVTAQTPLRPETPYGLSKLLAEQVLDHWAGDPESLLHLRLGYVVGAGLAASTMIRRLALARQADAPVELVNPDTTRLQLIDARDVARIALAALEQGVSGAMIAAGTPGITVEDVWQAIAREVHGTGAVSRRDDPATATDTFYESAPLAALGLAPRIPPEQAIADAMRDLAQAPA